MAKDERLYARFDIGLPDSEKILPLSDKAFRAFFEAIFYSRTQLTDGFLADAVVRKKWGLKVAAELTSNHSERPSWFPVDGGWQIHDYDKHQTTRADIEAKRDAGRKGGLARAERYQTASTPLAGAKQNPGTMLAKTETETETKTKEQKTPAPAVRTSASFDTFWEAWPLKKGKKEARIAFDKALKSGATLERILEGVENYKREIGPTPDWSKVKWPQGWLNAERWEDEPAPKPTMDRRTAYMKEFGVPDNKGPLPTEFTDEQFKAALARAAAV